MHNSNACIQLYQRVSFWWDGNHKQPMRIMFYCCLLTKSGSSKMHAQVYVCMYVWACVCVRARMCMHRDRATEKLGTSTWRHHQRHSALCARCVCRLAPPPSSIRALFHPHCTAQARSSAAALRLVPYRAISIYFSPGAAASSNPAALWGGLKDDDCCDVDRGRGFLIHLRLFSFFSPPLAVARNRILGAYRQQAREE